MPADDRPIFILATGQRCGSTLLQRLLNSHPEIFIWGEQDGLLQDLLRVYEDWSDAEGIAEYSRDRYLSEGYDFFSALMRPPLETVGEAARCFVRTLFSGSLGEHNKPRWGFKEVRYGLEMARFLWELFPDSRVVHLTRNVVDSFISMKAWEDGTSWGWTRARTEQALETWQQINAGFLGLGFSPYRYFFLRYEDLIGDPSKAVARLCAFLAIDPTALDMSVFNRRIHGLGPKGDQPRRLATPASLSAEERALLTRPDLLEVSAALGYGVAFDG